MVQRYGKLSKKRCTDAVPNGATDSGVIARSGKELVGLLFGLVLKQFGYGNSEIAAQTIERIYFDSFDCLLI